MRRFRARLVWAWLGLPGLIGPTGCDLAGRAPSEPAPDSQVYRHNRFDYWAFRARYGRLPEPNYLPWVAHREVLSDGDQAYVFCRLPDAAFPLRYAVPAPDFAGLDDEYRPRPARAYVEAVEKAFAQWQKVIGRPVRFERVERPEDADLVVHVLARPYQVEQGSVLGLVRDEEQRCRVTGAGGSGDLVSVDYAPRELFVYMIDTSGLLTPRQVHTVVLHEIGHILGASGQHSPLRGDVMFQIASDQRVEMLSEHDANTFRALYRLPPGAIYARMSGDHLEPPPEIRRQPPLMGDFQADERHGFQARFPKNWQVIRTPRGFIAVDGLSWDHDASVQVVAARGELESFVARQVMRVPMRGELVHSEVMEMDGQDIARLVVSGGDWTEDTAVLQWSEGWVLVLIADSRSEDYPLYRPWFSRVLMSIEPLEADERSSDEGSSGDGDVGAGVR